MVVPVKLKLMNLTQDIYTPDVVILPVAYPYKLSLDLKLRKILALAGFDTDVCLAIFSVIMIQGSRHAICCAKMACENVLSYDQEGLYAAGVRCERAISVRTLHHVGE